MQDYWDSRPATAFDWWTIIINLVILIAAWGYIYANPR